MDFEFDFDPAESAASLKKPGIDVVGVQALWSDPDRLEIAARPLDEPRTQVIGRIGDLVWSAFITRRGDLVRSSRLGEHAMKTKQRTSKTLGTLRH